MHTSHPIRRGLRWSAASVVWTTVACTTALAVGLAVHSLSVVAFAGVGLVDVVGSVALVWHFRHGVAHGDISDGRDTVVALLVAVGMLIVAVATSVVAVARLMHADTGSHGMLGAAVAAPSAVALAVLAVGKRRSGRAIPSDALVADGNVSALGAVFASIAVAGAVAESAGHLWWLDPVCSIAIALGAAVMVVAAIARSGLGARISQWRVRSIDRVADLVYPYRRTTGWLAWVGASLAGATAPLAWTRTGVASALPFVAVAVVLFAGGVACRRGSRVVLAIAGFALAGQLVGVIGAGARFALNPDDAKAAELRSLGLNPRLGSAVNVVYSAVAFGVFVVSWRHSRRSRA